VAASIPTPGAALCSDEAAWSAFTTLLGDAATRIAELLGRERCLALRGTARQAPDPVSWMLLEMVLDRTGA
jgi:hypothetical protein